MKTKIILFTFLLLSYFSGFSTTYTVVSSGYTFSPATITINSGDNVIFSIASSHNVVEVSQTTYNSNGNTPLSGGFSLPYGGGTLLPAALPVGTHYYVCSPHASMGMKAIIIVQACSAPAQPAAITGSANICSGTSNTYSITAVSGATSYTWTLPSGWSGTSTTTSITASASTTSGNISVTANNSCGSSAVKTLAVTVNTMPAQPAAITGSASICNGTSNTYSIAAVSGATSYTWTLPSGWSGSSATSSITAVASASGGTISVTANNSCGSSVVKTLVITVNAIPAQPIAITGNASICSGTSNTYSIAAVSGATSYTWTLPSGWSGSSATSSITAVANNAGGNITVKANNSCGSSATQTLSITTNSIDTAVSLSGSTLTANATGATYQWINCNGNVPISGQMSQSFTAVSSGSYAVIVTKNGCSDTSLCHAVIITGINEAKANTTFSLYPNPSNGRFTIETNQTGNSSIEIYNLIGELCYQANFTSAKTEIDFSTHNSGVYFLKLITGTTQLTKRIIIQ